MRAVLSGKADLRELIKNIDPDDLYNFDETGLFFRLQLNKTLTTEKTHETKKVKDRLTVALCTNATGTDKLKQIVIAKAARPRCFGKTFNPNSLVHYKSNANAWMTTREFHDFLESLNKQMSNANKHILLLLDNCASHSQPVVPLTHVKLHFLPPNTTSHIQPSDAGIIENFKAHYRKQLVRLYVQCIDDHEHSISSAMHGIQ